MIPLTKKYLPKTSKEIIGQDTAINNLKEFINNFKKKQKKKAILIYGPSGSGKTCSVYTLANELNLEILEVNASDTRNKEGIESNIGAASVQMSLFSKGKIILIDEIDGLSGTRDRGGINALCNIIEKTGFPLVLTATNPWDTKFSTLRKKCILIEFHTLNYLSVFHILKNICDKEKIKYDEETLKALARKSGGDARAAINDLETLSRENKKIEKSSLDELGEREQLETILQALMKIFKTTDVNIAISALDNVDEDLDKAILWIDENLPKEYEKPKDLASAYEMLSRADVFKGRIRRWQHWRFLVYINALITAGIAVSKDEKYHKFVKYSPTSRILKIYIANMRHQKRKAIAHKIGMHTHSSSKRVIGSTLPYLKIIFKKNKDIGNKIAEELDLDKEEVEWLKK